MWKNKKFVYQVGNNKKVIIPSQLYLFWAMFSSIIGSTWLYLQYLVVFAQVAAGCQPAATWANITRYCKYSHVLLMMGENIAQTSRADLE